MRSCFAAAAGVSLALAISSAPVVAEECYECTQKRNGTGSILWHQLSGGANLMEGGEEEAGFSVTLGHGYHEELSPGSCSNGSYHKKCGEDEGETLAYSGAELAEFARAKDIAVLTTLVRNGGDRVVLNASANALQVLGCDGVAVIRHVPIPSALLRELAATV